MFTGYGDKEESTAGTILQAGCLCQEIKLVLWCVSVLLSAMHPLPMAHIPMYVFIVRVLVTYFCPSLCRDTAHESVRTICALGCTIEPPTANLPPSIQQLTREFAGSHVRTRTFRGQTCYTLKNGKW